MSVQPGRGEKERGKRWEKVEGGGGGGGSWRERELLIDIKNINRKRLCDWWSQ